MGRAHELERLHTVMARVAAGSGSVVLVSGETGVGKTHLAHKALAAALARGFLPLAGKANPLTRDLPYGPIVEALARFLGTLDPPHRASLTTDLPALGQLIVGLDLPVPESLGDPSLEKTRLFESVLRFLDRSARGAPLLFLLDDLQWFDRSSLELLAYLTKDLPELPILLVGTYRADEALENASFDSLVHTFRRAQITDEIELTSFGEAELGEIIASSVGGTVPAMVVEWVAQQSAGIPLFAEALVAALRDQGILERTGDRWILVGPLASPAPPLVRDIVREQLHRLSESERQLVEVVAVAGDDAPRAVLEEVSRLVDLEGHLGGLIAARILVERATNEVAYGFAHPLTAQVAYDDISPPERRQLHARFAEAWERRAPLEYDRLALHYRGAMPDVDADRSVEVSIAAGERALDRYANAEALEHLEAALAFSAAAGRGDLTEQILVLLGEARYRTGDISSAVEAWDQAMRIGADEESPVRIARLHTLAARALAEADYEAADRRVEAGLAVLANVDASEALLEILFLGVITAHRIGWLDVAEDRTRRLAEAVERMGADHGRALLATAEATVLLDRGDYHGALSVLEENGDTLSEGGPQIEMRGHMLKAAIAAAWGDLPALGEANRQAAGLVRRTGVPSGEIRLQLSTFIEAFYGDWERAREVAEETRLLAETLAHTDALLLAGLFEALLAAFRGDLDHADRHLAETRAVTEQRKRYRPIHDILRDLEALVALERGDPNSALATLGARKFTPGPLPPLGLVVRGEAEARAGMPVEVLKTAELFERYGPTGSYPDATGSRMRGLAAGALGDSDEAIRQLSYAWSTFDSLDLTFEAARAGIELAEVVVRSGQTDPDLSDQLVRWYQATSWLGASRYVERARRLLHALGRTLPSQRGGGELTPRQVEVAELVAAGLSNAEIGEQLYVSVRTVHSHLDHIYTRLGLNSRAALAVWVTERRLHAPT